MRYGYIHIEVTTRCPVGCKQCYASATNSGIDMDLILFAEVLQKCKEFGLYKILLTGGEPMAYPHLVDSVRMISDCGLKTVISSSGVGLDEEMALRLIEAGLEQVHISLNGSNRRVHNMSRGCFDEGVKGIKNIKEAGGFCGINWVGRADNIEDFPDLVRLAVDMKVDRLTVLANKKKNGVIDSLIEERQLFILKEMIEEYKDDLPIYIDPCFRELSRLILGSEYNEYCRAGEIFLDVCADGTILPCRQVGETKDFHDNIRNYCSLKEYVSKSEEFMRYRNHHCGFSCQEE